ncbi:uncharacterized protein [Lolium perenne]|uniref:uncharacterized protein n=1 Tax=Lolium perenne TaxID=4522 RepID=UPI003A995A90
MSSTVDAAVRKGPIVLTRTESITEYINKGGQPRSGTQGQSDTPVSANDMCALDEWPSHARRYRVQLQDEADGQKKKKGQGVVKGVKAVQKRFANGSAKLNITFSETLGGKIGMNYRSFKDDVVVIMKRKVPLIGVRRWSDIHPSVHRLIVADVIDRWDLEDTPETEEKILRIAQERYRGWRSTLSSTYKAFKTDDARLANVPEDLQPEEWEWMINYFGNDEKFQARSQVNSDNRKKQKTKHRVGSKSYAQLSFEKRNLETGEEPDCVALWELTHTKNGTWSNPESQEVYDKAREAVQNKETETKGPLSTEQRNNVFQTAYKDTVQCKSSQPRGYGYKAKPKTGSERLRMQIEDQARVAAETLQRNCRRES